MGKEEIMSKAEMENKRVKRQITKGLFSLMKKKAFSEISVTDLVTEAGVARASYYRNFENKEAIIENVMDDLREELMKDIDYDDDASIFDAGNARRGFEKALSRCLTLKEELLILYKNGFGSLIQETFNRYTIEFAGNMPADSIERYKLYFVAGASANVLLEWLKEGAKETPEEIADICVSYLMRGILHMGE